MFFLFSAITNILTIAYVIGFFVFIENLPVPDLMQSQPADAIVVLTGRSGRIAEGLELFKQKKAKVLYISGVHPDVKKGELFPTKQLTKKQLACCVIFDSIAKNTHENAIQTAKWANKNNVNTIILVTDAMHLPRALILFRSAMPSSVIIAHPLAVESIWRDWQNLDLWFSAVKEYTKYVFVSITLGTK